MKTAIKWWDKLQKDKVQFSYSESKLKKNCWGFENMEYKNLQIQTSWKN